MSKYTFRVDASSDALRLDQCLARHVPQLSRRTAKLALDIGCVFVNRKRVKAASRRVRTGDEITANLGAPFERALSGIEEPSAKLTFARLFEDDHVVVVNKPAGLLTAPTPEGDRNNLQRQLQQDRGSSIYVVHRLDLQTSGILVFAKSKVANRELSNTFREHSITRRYDAFVEGQVTTAPMRIDVPVGGKQAATRFALKQVFGRFTWLEATLETGRTHQIRRHAQAMGHPVLSDPSYGTRAGWGPPRLGLHAKHLGFRHPVSEQAMNFDAELPSDLADWLRAVEGPPSA